MVEYILLLPRDDSQNLSKRIFGMPLLARLVYRLETDATTRTTLVGNLSKSSIQTALKGYPKKSELVLPQALSSTFTCSENSNTVIFWDATLMASKQTPELLQSACTGSNSAVELTNKDGASLGALALPASMCRQALDLEGISSVADVKARIKETTDVAIKGIVVEGYAQNQNEPGATKILKKQLLNELKKPVEIDGPSAAYIHRPIALALTRMLAWAPVSPNHATAFALLTGLIGAFCMSMGTEKGFIVGGSLLVAGAIIDCIDGNIARLKDQGSYTGAWFDTITDDICNTAFMAGTGIGLYRNTGELWMLLLGIGAALIVIPGLAVQYRILHSLRLADVCDYPWLFEAKENPEPPTFLQKAITGLKFLMKRDTYVMFFLGFILLGLPWLIVAFSFVGGVVWEIVLVADLRKKRSLRKAEKPS